MTGGPCFTHNPSLIKIDLVSDAFGVTITRVIVQICCGDRRGSGGIFAENEGPKHDWQ